MVENIMRKNKTKYKIWLKPIAVVLVCLFGFNSISFADGNSLSIWTAMERPEVKRETMATMYRQGRLIWVAQSEKYLNLLKNYNALALLLPSGRYLMAPETANNSLSLIRAATHEDYEVLMQREERLHNTRYQRIMNHVLNNKEIMHLYYALSHYKEFEKQPDNIIFNDLIAKAFEILFLLDQKLVHPASELTDNEKKFVALMRPILEAKDIMGRYKNFSQLFFDIDERTKVVRSLQEDRETRFYRVASNKGKDIHNISYLLDQVEYAGDKEIKVGMKEQGYAKEIVTKLLGKETFYIQNNRKTNRTSRCSGRCWFCYAHRSPLQERQKETSPMQISDATAIIAQAIQMGFEDIQLNGEDTLDDLESFWALVDACKDKPIKFSFFTSGFYLIRHHEQSLEFFKQLKQRLGNVKRVGLTLSWDPEKVSRAKEFSEFAGNEDAVFKAMAHVIHNFNEVFPASTEKSFEESYLLSVDAHDLGTGSEKQAQKNYDEFHNRIQSILQSEYGHGDKDRLYIYTDWGWITLMTPEAVAEGIKRGRVYNQFTVESLFRKMAERQRSTCSYSPFFDMSMGEIVTCIRRQEYPRRVVTPASFGDVLLKPLFNPRSRHLYVGRDDERRLALVKQLGFALALNPSLKGEMQVSFEEVESLIFSNEEIMTKIELLYLLEDILYMERGGKEEYRISRIPKELIEPLLNAELLNALLIYYTSYRIGERPAMLSQIVTRYRTQPHEAVSELQGILRKAVIPQLEEQGIISIEPAEKAPASFSKSATAKKPENLPTLAAAGFNLIEQLRGNLSSRDESKRRMGFNLLETAINNDYDLATIRGMLETNLTPARLTEKEQLLVVDLLDEWSNRPRVQEKYDVELAVQITTPFIFGPSQIVRARALNSLIKLDDEMISTSWHPRKVKSSTHILPNSLVKRLYDETPQLTVNLDTITTIRLCRKFFEFNLMGENEATERITTLSLPSDTEGLMEEIRKWKEHNRPFIVLLKDMLNRATKSYEKGQVMELLGKSAEGRKIVLDVIKGARPEDYGDTYLDSLDVLVEGRETRAIAIQLLNDLPVTFFEGKDIFIHIAHSNRDLLKHHRAPEVAIMLECLEELTAGSLITGALDKYFAITGRGKSAPPSPRFGHSGNDVDYEIVKAREEVIKANDMLSKDTILSGRHFNHAVERIKKAIELLRTIDFDELDSSGFPVADMINQAEVAIWVLEQLKAEGLLNNDMNNLLELLKDGKNGLELKQALGYNKQEISQDVRKEFESLNSAVRKSDLNKSASQFSGACQKTYDVSKMRFYIPVEVLKNSADVTITLNRIGMLNSSIKESSILFELVVTGVTDDDMELINSINRNDVKQALNLPKNLKVGIIAESEIQGRAKLAAIDIVNPKVRTEIIKQLSLEARPLEQGEVMAIVTNAVAEGKAEELEELLKPELADNISIRVAVSPEAGKSMFSLSSIINDWLKDIQQGKKSTINIILPAILSPAEMIRQLENAVRSAWQVLAAA